jgi:ATP-dependent Lon protease
MKKKEESQFELASEFWYDELSEVNERGENGEENGQDGSPVFNSDVPETLPILPLKNTVLFPGVVMPITLGRKKSIRLVESANRGNRIIGVVAQRNMTEEPTLADLYSVGIVAQILRVVVLPDGTNTLLIQGMSKMEISELVQTEPWLVASVKPIRDTLGKGSKKEGKVLLDTLRETASKLMALNPDIPPGAKMAFENIQNPISTTYFLAGNITASLQEKQDLLEMNEALRRAEGLLRYLNQEIQLLELKHQIQNKVSGEIDQQQRDFFLKQQIKALQDELGGEGAEAEIENFRKKAAGKVWSEAVEKHFNKELDKLARINPMAAEYSIAMNYVEFLTDLPWGEYSKDNFNLKRAKKILDADHHGLEKVKERILEYLAVLKLKQNMKSPILCLYGPPGVGKTSLGKSVAKALGREYIRMSLGGVHDEAEIRGHRKTYIGAMPGRIISNIKKAGTSNPVFILDEIDKLGNDFRGDPAAALLEVLDPEQNSTFADNYLEVEYDLSKVLFIATTNSLDSIHPALRDRMEIIELNGYTLEEKIQIAKKHLIPKQLDENGLKDYKLKFETPAIGKVIESYTAESGVRSLERNIGKLIRKIAKQVVMEEENIVDTITPEVVGTLLGPERYEKELYQDNEVAGVVTGLAWTSVGGEILFVESSLSKGNGKMTLSGQLGDVMKESAVAALSYLKANSEALHIDYRVFHNYDIHIHIPAGAVPKDGPSAGITMLTSLASAFTQRAVRAKLAMTGEITLRGKVLPVGGIKEKLLAARRAGIQEVIMCSKNKRDLEDINPDYLKGLQIHFVNTVDDVLAYALLPEKVMRPIDLSYLGEAAASKVLH